MPNIDSANNLAGPTIEAVDFWLEMKNRVKFMSRFLCSTALCALCSFNLSSKSYGVETTWCQELANGKRVFANIPSTSITEELTNPGVNAEECRRIRSLYPETGLYTSDQPPQLIWRLNLPWIVRPVFFSRDGDNLLVPGDFVEDSYPLNEDVIATFVHRGSVIKVVRYGDIAHFASLKRQFAPRRLLSTTSAEFVDDKDEYIVKTNVGETIVFDVKSGAIKEYRDPFRVATLIIGGVAPILLLASLVAWYSCHAKRRSSV
jgi:hypothetical protein